MAFFVPTPTWRRVVTGATSGSLRAIGHVYVYHGDNPNDNEAYGISYQSSRAPSVFNMAGDIWVKALNPAVIGTDGMLSAVWYIGDGVQEPADILPTPTFNTAGGAPVVPVDPASFDPWSWSVNENEYKEYHTAVPYLNMFRNGKWTANNSGANTVDVEFNADWIPAAIPTGNDRLRCSIALNNDNTEALFGNYVFRYTPHAGYTVAFTGGSGQVINEVVGTNRVDFELAATGNLKVEIIGPEGPVPDFEVELFKAENETFMDDTTIPWTDARKIFSPDYLNLLKINKFHHIRLMKPLETELGQFKDVADLIPFSAKNYLHGLPIEAAVALCNEVNTGLYYCIPHRASDAVVQFMAEYVRDNLHDHLPVYVELFNEWWNGQYAMNDHWDSIGVPRFEPQGTGTVDIAYDGTTITASGIDLTTVFGPSPLAGYIIIGDYSYRIDVDTVTANSMTTHAAYIKGKETLTGAAYWPTNDLHRETGFIIRSSQVMDITRTVFGSDTRLNTCLSTNLNVPALTDRVLNDSDWENEPDYIDPKVVHSRVAANCYIASKHFNETGLKELVETTWDSGNGLQASNELFADIYSNTVDGFTLDRGLDQMEAMLTAQRAILDPLGIPLMAYEGGFHLIHSGVINGTGAWDIVFEAHEAFLNSPEVVPIVTQWYNLQVTGLNGGPVDYVFLTRDFSHFGHYALYPGVPYGNNTQGVQRRLTVQSMAENTAKWWT